MIAALQAPYNLAQQQLEQRALGANTMVGEQTALLNKSIAEQNAMANSAIAQRQQAIRAILAQANQQQAGFNQQALTDLQAQGINPSGYNQASGLEGQRLVGLGAATQLYGTDLDALARQAAAARTSYAGQSRMDALNNIQAGKTSLLNQIALQRAQDEAKIRAQAAAAGVKI